MSNKSKSKGNLAREKGNLIKTKHGREEPKQAEFIDNIAAALTSPVVIQNVKDAMKIENEIYSV